MHHKSTIKSVKKLNKKQIKQRFKPTETKELTILIFCQVPLPLPHRIIHMPDRSQTRGVLMKMSIADISLLSYLNM